MTNPRPPLSPDCFGKQAKLTLAQKTEFKCFACSFAISCANESYSSAAVPSGADSEQAGGDHYKRMEIQPWAVIDTWPLAERIGFYRGNLLKYTMRMHDKDVPKDNIEKAAHYARKLAEVLAESGEEKIHLTVDMSNAGRILQK